MQRINSLKCEKREEKARTYSRDREKSMNAQKETVIPYAIRIIHFLQYQQFSLCRATFSMLATRESEKKMCCSVEKGITWSHYMCVFVCVFGTYNLKAKPHI